MTRANKRDTAIRAALEDIGGELAVIDVKVPLIRLAVEHARERTGLDTLLVPARGNADTVIVSADKIRRLIRTALDLVEQ